MTPRFPVTAALVEAARAEGWTYEGATLNQAWPGGTVPAACLFWHPITGPRVFRKETRGPSILLSHDTARALLARHA